MWTIEVRTVRRDKSIIPTLFYSYDGYNIGLKNFLKESLIFTPVFNRKSSFYSQRKNIHMTIKTQKQLSLSYQLLFSKYNK